MNTPRHPLRAIQFGYLDINIPDLDYVDHSCSMHGYHDRKVLLPLHRVLPPQSKSQEGWGFGSEGEGWRKAVKMLT